MTINNLLDSLTSHGWYVWDNFLSSSEIQAIKDSIPDTLKHARVGHLDSLQDNKNIRGDLTVWLEPEMGAPIKHYLDKMDGIRQSLNSQLYLGLQDFETHFCRYPSGAFYQKHHDNPQSKSQRKVTSVLYMNESWQPEDAGELVMYDNEGNTLLKLEPVSGRMIFFMSEDFPHEVLSTTKTRESIAGWFLTQKQL